MQFPRQVTPLVTVLGLTAVGAVAAVTTLTGTRRGTVTGMVTCSVAGGARPANATAVCAQLNVTALKDDDGTLYTTLVDHTGHYTLSLPPGAYEIAAGKGTTVSVAVVADATIHQDLDGGVVGNPLAP